MANQWKTDNMSHVCYGRIKGEINIICDCGTEITLTDIYATHGNPFGETDIYSDEIKLHPCWEKREVKTDGNGHDTR